MDALTRPSRPDRPERAKKSPASIALKIVLVVVIALTVWSVFDASANVPVISPIVSSVKGGIWDNGSAVWGIEPGCYQRPAEVNGNGE
jgi:hypothetical protein